MDHSGTPDDTESYNLLLQVLREKLDELGARNNKFYGLTAALPCGPSNINNIDIETASKYLTELNLMTYDFFGAWSPTTGVNAPLYDQDWGGEGAKDFSVDGCVRNWMKGGGSPSKINIGLVSRLEPDLSCLREVLTSILTAPKAILWTFLQKSYSIE